MLAAAKPSQETLKILLADPALATRVNESDACVANLCSVSRQDRENALHFAVRTSSFEGVKCIRLLLATGAVTINNTNEVMKQTHICIRYHFNRRTSACLRSTATKAAQR